MEKFEDIEGYDFFVGQVYHDNLCVEKPLRATSVLGGKRCIVLLDGLFPEVAALALVLWKALDACSEQTDHTRQCIMVASSWV